MRVRASIVTFFLVLALPRFALAGSFMIGPYEIDPHAYPDVIVQVAGPAWAENLPGWTDSQTPHCVGPPTNYLLREGPPGYEFEVYGILELRSDIVFELLAVMNQRHRLSLTKCTRSSVTPHLTERSDTDKRCERRRPKAADVRTICAGMNAR